MPWFKSDDSLWRHPKVRRLGKDKLAAMGLWELCGTWCADNILTNPRDGFVPDDQVETLDPKHRYAQRLVAVGLWEETTVDGEHGYVFHDWADYNPTRASVEADREEWRTRKANQRKRKRVSQGDTNEDSREESSRESQPSRSRTRSRPSSGHLEGAGPDSTAGALPRPAERCPKHAEDPDPPSCGACASARRAAEAWDRDEPERERQRADADRQRRVAVARCRLCDGDGWRWNPEGKHRGVLSVRCNHEPDQLEAS